MSPAGTTWSLYDTWDHLVAETDNAGHILREYMWIGDEPVAVIDWTITSGTPVLHFVHTDHLHRPELMTDTSGAVIWKASYEPFGTVASITGSSTENQRFPGQWFQLEAGLAYNWHRHYDSTTGRYTTPDPLGLFLSPSPSAPQPIAGGAVDSSAAPTLTGVTNAPSTPVIDPGMIPEGVSNLLAVQKPTFGMTAQAPASNATTVPRDRPSLFGYAQQNPLLFTDKGVAFNGRVYA